MTRIGTACLVLSLLAGCEAPVSLKHPLPPVAGHGDTFASPPALAEPSVQVFPLDASSSETDSSVADFSAIDDDALATHDPAHERLRGVLSEQGWQLCGQASPKQMRVSPEARRRLESFLLHQPIFFLDGWGRVVGNEIELLHVERMAVDGPGCREPLESFLWVAQGQKPSWALAVTHGGVQLRIPGESARSYNYVAAQGNDEQIRYVGSDYRLTLYRQDCTGAVDTHYSWRAELYAADRQWQGCAWQGLQGMAGH